MQVPPSHMPQVMICLDGEINPIYVNMARLRIAPSPTGPFHIGTARTALFNYLYAKQHNGSFIVRIEDTDTERSESRYEREILEGLAWLGIEPDEGPLPEDGEVGEYGPYRQSERMNQGVYRPYIQQLLDSGWAYYDDTSKEELDRRREAAEQAGEPFVFRGNPYKQNIDYDQAVIRFRSPEDKAIFWRDQVRGEVRFDSNLLGDFVIAKGLDHPLYNLAVVIDDARMEITHIIRGEDHVSNTPKQMLLNEMLGFTKKTYAHIPLILGEDKSKLSKRHGAVTVSWYREQGYLPEAMVNFLALLGWREPNDRETYALDELIDAFRVKRIQKSGAVFDYNKLDNLNARYMKALPADEKYRMGKKFLEDNGWNVDSLSEHQLQVLIDVECQRIHTFGEMGTETRRFWNLEDYPLERLRWKETELSVIKDHLEHIEAFLEDVQGSAFEPEYLETNIKQLLEEQDIPRGEVLWPLRVALSGREQSPSPFEIATILGKTESLRRIRLAKNQLQEV